MNTATRQRIRRNRMLRAKPGRMRTFRRMLAACERAASYKPKPYAADRQRGMDLSVIKARSISDAAGAVVGRDDVTWRVFLHGRWVWEVRVENGVVHEREMDEVFA